MSTKFPDVNSKQIIKIAEKLGFLFVRQCGTGHAIYMRQEDKRRTTVPIHGKKSLKRKTIKAICKDLNITVDELKELL